MFRILFAVMAVFALGSMGVGAPQLTVDADEYHFGEVTDGTYVVHAFLLTNTGDSVLEFTADPIGRMEVPPGLCPCVDGYLSADSLKPGESAHLRVEFESTGYGGRDVVARVEVHSNDRQTPIKRVRLRGTILPRAPHQGSADRLVRNLRILLDLREPRAFARGHLLGAINLPYAQLLDRLHELPKNLVYYLYDAEGAVAPEATQHMRDEGFRTAMAISGGLAGWWAELDGVLFRWAEGVAPTPPDGTPQPGRFTVAPGRVSLMYNVVADTRPATAYAQGHIPGSVNVPPGEIVSWTGALLEDVHAVPDAAIRIWLVDDGGGTACAAAQQLRDEGNPEVLCLLGGFDQWAIRQGQELVWTDAGGRD